MRFFEMAGARRARTSPFETAKRHVENGTDPEGFVERFIDDNIGEFRINVTTVVRNN